jgi:hypothetical protein
LDDTLKNIGFCQSPLEHGLYVRGNGNSKLLIGVYVDDLIVMGSCSREIKNFKNQMEAEFKMSDLGSLSFYLGIEVHQDKDRITLSQGAYDARIIEKGRAYWL